MFKTEGESSDAAEDSVRKLMCFVSTQAFKPILIVTQNKIMKLKMSIRCLL